FPQHHVIDIAAPLAVRVEQLVIEQVVSDVQEVAMFGVE
ncbi:MAG: hypothetical protein JWN72_1044, partial [Thermoleophilia bacterium]|nr:hypothetical protein [Thermoleophilia bacterium]